MKKSVNKHFWKNWLACMLVLLCLPLAAQAGVAGRFQFVNGDVRVVSADGRERLAVKGAEVLEQESVLTGAAASAQIKMIDGALLALRAETQMKMEAYVFNEAGADGEKAWFSLLKGGLRSLTGLIGKRHKENYAIRTPQAVIGIRGTDHEPVVILPDTVAAQKNPPGTYDKVNLGRTSLSTQAGVTLIERNQIGFASAPNLAPVLLQKMPDFYQNSQPPKAAAKDAGSKDSGAKENSDKENSAKESSDKDSSAGVQAAQVRPVSDGSALPSGPADDTNTASAAANPSSRVGDAPSAALVLTAASPSGASINTGTQSLTTASGSGSISPESLAKMSGQIDLVVSYSKAALQDAAKLASLQSIVHDLGAGLNNYGRLLQNTDTAQVNALTALESAKLAAASAQSSNQAALLAVAQPAPALLFASQESLAASQLALTQSDLALQGGSAKNAGNKVVQEVANLAYQVLTRYNGNLQKWQADNSAATRLALTIDAPALSNLGAQTQDRAAIALQQAATAVQQAQSSAEQAIALADSALHELAQLAAADPHFTLLQQAANEAKRSAGLAQVAANAAQAAWQASQYLNAQASNMTNLTPSFQVQYEQPSAADMSNGASGMALIASRDASGHLISVGASSESNAGSGNQRLYFSDSAKPQLLDLGRDLASGMAWGRWQGGQVIIQEQYTDRDESGNIGVGAIDPVTGKFVLGLAGKKVTNQEQASLHWLTGVQATPQTLAQSLTGSASYTLLGATRPTDSLGNLGVLNSARLQANFSAQSMDALIKFSFGADQWEVGEPNIPLGGTRFEAQTCAGCSASGMPGGISILKKNGQDMHASETPPADGAAPGARNAAKISGSLMGAGLSSAGLQYWVTQDTSSAQFDALTGQTSSVSSDNIMQGVAAFGGSEQNIATPYRAVTADSGSLTWAAVAGEGELPSATASIYNAISANRIADSGAGMDEFIGTVFNYTPDAGAPPFDSHSYMSATIKRGSAASADFGSAVLGGTTVNWGRWKDGVVDIYSRDSSTRLGTINNQARSIHWLNISAITGEMATLPLTGSAAYTKIGGTQPTDLKGNVGVLNWAKVDVDFSAMKANASVGLSFNSPSNTSNWQLNTAASPLIQGGIGFNTSTLNNGVNGETHLISCSGSSCGSQNFSNLSAAFVGSGAPGLAFAYDMVSSNKDASGKLIPASNAHGLVILKK